MTSSLAETATTPSTVVSTMTLSMVARATMNCWAVRAMTRLLAAQAMT